MTQLEKPLFSLTVKEFLELTSNNPSSQVIDFSEPKKYVYGIGGLADLIGCSLPTAQRIKNSGTISFMQAGRKLIFDVEKVLEELSNPKGGLK